MSNLPTHGAPIPRTSHLQRMRQMINIWDKLMVHWKSSSFYEEQVSFIRMEILQVRSLNVDRAVCIGIGGLSNRRPRKGKGKGKGKGKEGKGGRGKEEKEEKENEKWDLDSTYDEKGLKGLCQLIIFQCWVEILREKFEIDKSAIHFHFPHGLNKIEELFMQGLGFGDNITYYYHDLKDVMSNTTFLFGTSKHVKHWHEGLLSLAVPGLVMGAPLEVNGYWKDYSRGTQRVFRRFLNTVNNRKLGPIVDVTSLPTKEQKKLRRDLDSKMSTELRMSDILMNYTVFWRSDPDPMEQRFIVGWLAPTAWYGLPGPTGIPGNIYGLGDVQRKWKEKNISWWEWSVGILPVLVYFEVVLGWIKKRFLGGFWQDCIPVSGVVEAVWDSWEENGKVWYLVETRTKGGTSWDYRLSEDLGPGAYDKVNDFHYACPGRKKGDV